MKFYSLVTMSGRSLPEGTLCGDHYINFSHRVDARKAVLRANDYEIGLMAEWAQTTDSDATCRVCNA